LSANSLRPAIFWFTLVAASLRADYVLLGQLQQGEAGLRFITHFIRLADEAHLKPIADFLLANGARPTIFSAAMMGQIDVVVPRAVSSFTPATSCSSHRAWPVRRSRSRARAARSRG
jgi:hypothetical protein